MEVPRPLRVQNAIIHIDPKGILISFQPIRHTDAEPSTLKASAMMKAIPIFFLPLKVLLSVVNIRRKNEFGEL
jgi:hypothetical protein